VCVERADDRASADQTIGERPAAVGAPCLYREDFPFAGAEHGDLPTVHYARAALAEWNRLEGSEIDQATPRRGRAHVALPARVGTNWAGWTGASASRHGSVQLSTAAAMCSSSSAAMPSASSTSTRRRAAIPTRWTNA